MLKLENIVAGYGHITALKDVSLEVPQGSVVSLIGANGAGKTTTMKTIMGLVKPTSGRVIFEGQDITGRQTHQIVHAGISLVPEGRQILQDMSVYENLEMGAYIRKDKEIEEDIKKVFKRFPILDERSYQLGWYVIWWPTTNACHWSCTYGSSKIVIVRRTIYGPCSIGS